MYIYIYIGAVGCGSKKTTHVEKNIIECSVDELLLHLMCFQFVRRRHHQHCAQSCFQGSCVEAIYTHTSIGIEISDKRCKFHFILTNIF